MTTVGEFTLTPILAVLMTVGAALILVFVLIAAYFCVRRGPSNGGSRRKRANDNRISYTETHIPLQKGIDDCIDDHNSGGTALTPMLPDHERNPDIIPISRRGKDYTANILTVLSTAFGSVTCATVIWLHILQPKIAIDLKLYSSVSLNVMCTVIACNSHCQITLAYVTQTMTVNWL